MTKENDTQVGGEHYVKMKVQPWDAMEAWLTAEEFDGFLRGNVIKYLARDKGGVEDLKKAQHYLSKLIEFLEETQPNENAKTAEGYKPNESGKAADVYKTHFLGDM